MSNIGKLIKDKRTEKNLSQRKLAELCGMSYSHICRLEKGENVPTIDTLTKIAGALEIPLNDFSIDSNGKPGKLLEQYIDDFSRERLNVFYELVKFIDIQYLNNKFDARLFLVGKNTDDMIGLITDVVTNRLNAYTEENNKTHSLEKWIKENK
jgi:transcriptional regulator with XRE-family HTH domain